jgi:hypothetical protein
MMNRRLYFLLPDKDHALGVVDELVREGIDTERMHTLGSEHTRLDGLPAPTPRQTNDAAGHLESFLWNANLISFALALVILVVLLVTTGWSLWLLAPAALMVTNFLAGLRFTRLPNTHLGEFRDAMAHGEILLMVDVPEKQVAEIEERVHQHHPEVVAGGVSWGTPAFGL